MNSYTRMFGWAIAAAVAAAAGCSKEKWPNEFDPTPANGVLTVNGQPLGGALVIFHPVDPAEKRKYPAFTGPDGKFSASAFRTGDGTKPGEYILTVQPSDNIDNTGPMFPDEPAAQDAMNWAEKSIKPVYRAVGTSPVRVTVAEGQPDLGEIKLTN